MKPTLCQNVADTQWGRFCEEEGQGRRVYQKIHTLTLNCNHLKPCLLHHLGNFQLYYHFFNGHKQLWHLTCQETIPKWAYFSQIDHKNMAKVFWREHSKTIFSLHFCEKTLPPKWSLVIQLIKTACHPMNVFSTDNHTKVKYLPEYDCLQRWCW